jgi:hypothetical protein
MSSIDEDEKLFADFIVKFGRSYANKEEYLMRFNIFKNTLNKIRSHDHSKHGN